MGGSWRGRLVGGEAVWTSCGARGAGFGSPGVWASVSTLVWPRCVLAAICARDEGACTSWRQQVTVKQADFWFIPWLAAGGRSEGIHARGGCLGRKHGTGLRTSSSTGVQMATLLRTLMILSSAAVSLIDCAALARHRWRNRIAVAEDTTSDTRALRRRLQSVSLCSLPNATDAYAIATPPSLGLPDPGLPDIVFPRLGSTVDGLGGVSCADGYAGLAVATCEGASSAGGGGSAGGSVDTSNMGGLTGSTYKWAGGVLAGNGKIYGIPGHAASVLIIDPVAGTTDTSSMGGLTGLSKWFGGVLAGNGKIYGMPNNAES
eukprot:COSAG02_NODE_13523_length_1383_cov_2.374611_1_plen_317_part_10